MNFDCNFFNYKIVTLFKIFSNIYKNKHEMIMIAKRFRSFVSLRNLNLSQEKYIAPQGKCLSPPGTIMFVGGGGGEGI